MDVNFDLETLRVTLEPESEDEWRSITKMLQVFRLGGRIQVTPWGRKPITTKYRRKIKSDGRQTLEEG